MTSLIFLHAAVQFLSSICVITGYVVYNYLKYKNNGNTDLVCEKKLSTTESQYPISSVVWDLLTLELSWFKQQTALADIEDLI